MLSLHCCAGFSLVVEREDHSLVAVLRFLIAVAFPIVEHGSRYAGFNSCDLVALQHVGSSRIRDLTHVSCNGRQILYH